MNYANLIQNITENIKTNGSQAITAQVLQDVLVDMVGELGQSGALLGGVIDTSFVPDPTNDAQVVYIAKSPGTYTNFNGLVVGAGEVAFFYFNGNAWVKSSVDVLEVVNNLNSTATDKALSAAMGKQIGDNISQLGQDFYMEPYPFSLVGYYDKDTGVLTSASNMTATPRFRVRKGDILSYKLSCNGAAIVAAFNEYGVYLPNSSVIQNESSVQEDTYQVPEGVCFIALCNYTSALAQPSASLNFNKNIGDAIFEALESLTGIKKEYPFDVNAYYSLDGVKHDSAYFHSTKPISVYEGCSVDYHCGVSSNSAATLLVLDASLHVIDYLAGISGEKQSGTYTIPRNGKFLICSYGASSATIDGMYAIVDYVKTGINIINDKFDKYIGVSAFTETGYINNNGSFVSLSGCICTDYIDVDGFNQIECYLSISAAGFCAFYFEDKSLISSFQADGRYIGEIPYGAKYVRACSFVSEISAPYVVLHKVSSYWENRRFAIFGTSIEAGYPKSSFENNRNRLDTYSFWNQAIRKIGGIPLNYAVPSGYICKIANAAQSFLGSTATDIDYGSVGIQNVNINNRLLDYIGTPNDADVYVFAYHVNDVARDSSLSDDSDIDYDSTDQSTFVGAYNYTLSQLYANKPTALVIICSHYSNDGFSNQTPEYYKKVNDVLHNIARKWGIMFIDITSCSEVLNNGFINNYSSYMTDAGHPANYQPQTGIELIGRLANAIEGKLKSFE